MVEFRWSKSEEAQRVDTFSSADLSWTSLFSHQLNREGQEDLLQADHRNITAKSQGFSSDCSCCRKWIYGGQAQQDKDSSRHSGPDRRGLSALSWRSLVVR